MPYRYATEKEDYTDYASGRVFYGAPGHPAFPIRLASEILQACIIQHSKSHPNTPYILYDPVCGGAYHLSILAYLHWETIHSVICSDSDIDILKTAQRNLSLLSLEGLDNRIAELQKLFETYGKTSHASALESAYRIRKLLNLNHMVHSIQTTVFHANVLEPNALAGKVEESAVDIVIADIPYGNRSTWQLTDMPTGNPTSLMLNNLLPHLSNNAIVAIAADKLSKFTHPNYQRIDRFQIGKRRIYILSPDRQS